MKKVYYNSDAAGKLRATKPFTQTPFLFLMFCFCSLLQSF